MNLIILFPIISMIAFGILNAISKPFLKQMDSMIYIFFRNIGVVTLSIIILFIARDTIVIDRGTILFAIFISAFSYLGFWAFNESIENGKIGIVVPISSTRVIITTLIATFLIGENLSPLAYSAIVLVFIGIALNSIDFSNLKKINILDFKSGIPQALISGLIWGISFAYFGKPSSILGAYLFGFIVESVVFVCASAQLLITKTNPFNSFHIIQKHSTAFIFVILFAVTGSLFMSLGFQYLPVSITSAITAASPFVTLLYAYFVFKEKLTKLQYLGASLIVVGVVAITLA